MFWDFIGIFFFVWEMMCCCLLISTFAEKRKYRYRVVTSAFFWGMIVSEYTAAYVLQDVLLVKIFVSLCVTSVFMYAIFYAKMVKIIALDILYFGIDTSLDNFFYLMIGKPFPESPESIYYIMMATSRIITLLIVLFIRFWIGKNTRIMLGKKEWLGLLSIPAITIFSGAAFVVKMETLEQSRFLVYVVMAMDIINVIVFFLVDSIFKREKLISDARIQYEKTKNEMNMYYEVSKNLDRQRKWTHDFKNHLACISELARNGDYYELKAYTAKLDRELTESADMIDTNHVIVNAIINTKYREALEKRIVFVLRVNDLSGLALSDMDIVTILSNLLNNAFEACEQCGNKVIKLKFVIEDNQTIISVKNSLAKQPVPKNGFFETTKKNMAEEHGIGIKNVCDVLEKYHAKYSIDFDDKEFSFSIVI